MFIAMMGNALACFALAFVPTIAGGALIALGITNLVLAVNFLEGDNDDA